MINYIKYDINYLMRNIKEGLLYKTLEGTKIYIVLMLISSALTSMLVVYLPKFIEYAVDGVVMGKEYIIPSYIKGFFKNDNWIYNMLVLAVFLVAINLIIVLIAYMKNKINTYFNIKINKNVKLIILEHVQKLEYKSFANIEKAEIIQRVNNDADIYSEFFNNQIALLFDTVFIVFFVANQIFKMSIGIGIFTLTLSLVMILLTIWYYKKSKPIVNDNLSLNKKIIQITNNTVQNAKMIRIFGRLKKEREDFIKTNEEYRKKDVKVSNLGIMYRITIHNLRNFKEPFILMWGGLLVVSGRLTLGQIAVMLSNTTQLAEYLYNLSVKLININDTILAYKRLNKLMQENQEIDNKPSVYLNGDIIFKDVNIFVNGYNILKNINIEIKKGEKVAIIGDNGTGKTILAKTLLGFYEYTGEICIGKQNIKDSSKKSLRDYIGISLQGNYLFGKTIKENIDLKNRAKSDEEIINVCKTAEIYDEIMDMEQGLDSMIETGGTNLSGGQKQRIEIARALFNDTEYIIFDDSLSKVDSNTKIHLLNNIMNLDNGIIIVSYDYRVAKKVDKIIFIEKEKVIQSTHIELFNNNDNYKKIIEISENILGEEYE